MLLHNFVSLLFGVKAEDENRNAKGLEVGMNVRMADDYFFFLMMVVSLCIRRKLVEAIAQTNGVHEI